MPTTPLSLSRITTKMCLRMALSRLESSSYSLKDYEIKLIREFVSSLAVSTETDQTGRIITSRYLTILTASEQTAALEAIHLNAVLPATS